MEQMMKHANNELLSDQEFCEEVILFYTDVHRKRYIAEHNMIRKSRSLFKRGDAYGVTLLETLFPSDHVKEQIYRQEIAMERMEKRMKDMEKHMDTVLQEKFYDCQAELIQQKEYVSLLQADEDIRKRRTLQYEQKIKEMLQTTDRELEGIEQTLTSLTQSPYRVTESVNGLKERKVILLKQKQSYTELLGFLE